ncbi:MAG: hypothetical protein IIA14_03775 [SAR324 cluster bacterium]|nr:hypothetical protein [SAR324 cluster bacterium]
MDLIDLGHMATHLGKRAIAEMQLLAKISKRAQAAAEKEEKLARKRGFDS